MVQTWSGWKRFPQTETEDDIEAPRGPGVYEVRHTLTGRVIAFGYAAHVAKALAALRPDGSSGAFARLFSRRSALSRMADLEYRICPADSRAEAKTAARRLLGLRQNAWRRRADVGGVARFPG